MRGCFLLIRVSLNELVSKMRVAIVRRTGSHFTGAGGKPRGLRTGKGYRGLDLSCRELPKKYTA